MHPSANDGGRFQLPLRGSAGMGPLEASAPASLFIRWRAPPEPTDTTYRGQLFCQHKMLWNTGMQVSRPPSRKRRACAWPGGPSGMRSEAQVEARPEAPALVHVPVAVEAVEAAAVVHRHHAIGEVEQRGIEGHVGMQLPAGAEIEGGGRRAFAHVHRAVAEAGPVLLAGVVG